MEKTKKVTRRMKLISGARKLFSKAL
jgi:hypothetical protein